MGYLILILGVALWWGAHLFKRVAPERRAEMGDKGKGLVAAAIAVSVVLMVIGFKWAEHIDLWYPPAMMTHANNLLVLIAIWMMSPAGQKGKLLANVRHPMLMGFRVWAAAHLLVNGDLASVILFGGLLAWGVAEVVVINKSEPDWTPRSNGSYGKDAMFFGASLVLLFVIGYVHGLIGPAAFPI
jgi:uncharacterized membrane protein